jgi:uncharacterized membrane protein YcfT
MIHEILAFIQNLLHQFDVWIYNSPTPGIIRDSKYAIPIIQTFHLVGITTILGTTVVTNLRLLNLGYREIPLDVIVSQLRRWFKIGLITTLASGFIVFVVDPVRYVQNTSFIVKMCLLLLAIIYQFTIFRRVLKSNPSPALSMVNLVPSVISLTLWFGVGWAGRAIAFFG